MLSGNRETSDAIRDQIQALAAASVARQYKTQRMEWAAFGVKNHEKSLRDTAYHLSYLAHAIVLDAPILFSEYINWCKVLFTSLGFSEQMTTETFRCLRETLLMDLSEPHNNHACHFFDEALQNANETVPVIPPTFLNESRPQYELAQGYLNALLQEDRAQAEKIILNAAKAGPAIQDLYINVIQPCQREIGRLWHTNKISVAQEHYATAVTQVVMAQLYPYLFSSAPTEKRGKAVVACVSGEIHELGARMLADFLEMDGWDSHYLGATTPAREIVQTVERHQAPLLCLSVTAALNLREADETITLLRGNPQTAKTIVLVGGYAFNHTPGLWRKIDADGYAEDAPSALKLALTLFAEKEAGERQ
jgi:methanogenic corrinoid protein MtbC1